MEDTFFKLLYLILGGVFVWFLYRYYKAKPEMFSSENLSKSFFSMGVLAILLIAFVAFLVLLVKA